VHVIDVTAREQGGLPRPAPQLPLFPGRCNPKALHPLRRDGLPLANHRTPSDLGVAVYFTYRGRQMCLACDQWDKIQDNIHAIRKTIEAFRGIPRWGTGDMMERAFTGFEELPAPGQQAKRPWWQVLGVNQNASPQAIKEA
jgi:hypothetical protein